MTERMPRMRIVAVIAALIVGGVGGIGGSMVYMYLRTAEETERADEAVAAAEELCAQVEDLGWTCVEDPDSLRGEAGPAGPAGPPPSDEQVYEAVEAFFVEHPVEAEEPSPAAIAAAVSNWLQEHPPADGEDGEPGPRGPGPSAAQVASAVEEYLTQNPAPAGPSGPAGEDGEDGEQGPAGPPPSASEIAAAVEAYIEEHPLPTCPEGSAAEPHTVLTTGGALDVIVCVEQG